MSLITSCICKNVTSTVPQVLKLDLLAWLSNPAVCHGKWKWGPHSETSLLFWARQSSQAFLMLALSLVYDIVRTVHFVGHSSTQIMMRMLAATVSGGISSCITCTLLFTWTHDYCWPCRQCLYCNPSWETIQAHYTTCLPCYQLCQHLLHAERPTKQHSHGPVRCFDPHRLWENLKVTKLCRLMEAVNVKRARCLVLRVNHRHKVLRLLSSNGREVKIWESNISKTYLWNFKDWWSKYIKVMEIQSDDWKGMAALALELVWNGLNDPNLSTSHDIPSYRLVDRGP